MSTQMGLLLRHALFFALPIGIALGMLRRWVREVAEKRKLACSTRLTMGSALLALAAVGTLGQMLFALLSPMAGAFMARLIGLMATGMAVGWIAGRTIAYLPILRAVLYGALAALPMQRAYLLLGVSHEWLARVVMALLLVTLIALAVTLPLPEMPKPRKRTASGIAGRDDRLSGSVTYLRSRPRTLSATASGRGLRGRGRKSR